MGVGAIVGCGTTAFTDFAEELALRSWHIRGRWHIRGASTGRDGGLGPPIPSDRWSSASSKGGGPVADGPLCGG